MGCRETWDLGCKVPCRSRVCVLVARRYASAGTALGTYGTYPVDFKRNSCRAGIVNISGLPILHRNLKVHVRLIEKQHTLPALLVPDNTRR